MKITFIRHAQSEYNIGQHFSNNVSITKDGIIASNSLNQCFDILILSPLKRAIQTYANSNIKTKKIMISDLFQEFKDKPSNMMDDDKSYETTENFEIRVNTAIDFLKQLDYSNIVIICHHDFIQKITKFMIGKSISLSNLSSYEIAIKNEVQFDNFIAPVLTPPRIRISMNLIIDISYISYIIEEKDLLDYDILLL